MPVPTAALDTEQIRLSYIPREEPDVRGNHDMRVRNKLLTKGEAALVFVNMQWL